MSNTIFIDHARFQLIEDSAAIRNLDAYQKVKALGYQIAELGDVFSL